MHIIRYSYPATRNLAPAFGFSGRSPWAGFEDEINHLLGSAPGSCGSGAQFPLSLSEDKDNVHVRAELPGIAREEIDLEIAAGRLSITAGKKRKDGDNEEPVSLRGSVDLPQEVQADKATATHVNGVLTVTLPKREEAKPQKIAVS
jgi:HSP20 family protein